MSTNLGGSPQTQLARKTSALDGAANNGQLAAPTITLFTVTGEVLIAALTATCTETHVSAGAGTLVLGVTGNTTFFIAATTATDIAAGDYWIDATPTEVNALAVPAGFKDIWLTDNIIATVGTANITDGTIRYDCYWLPLSADGNVVAA